MNHEMKKRLAGFTLAEVMTGMGVLAIALMAAFGLVNQTVRMIRPSREATLSSQAAQIEIERLRSSWDIFDALGETTPILLTDNPALSALPDGSGVIRKIPYDSFYTNAPVFAVSVVISWQTQRGDRATNVVSGIIGQNGLVR